MAIKKTIFIDVDGTLRTDKGEVTTNTIETLEKIKTIGYEPIICTGRPADHAEELNNKVSGSRYIIFNNGGGVFDSQDKKIIYQKPMNKNSILSLYKMSDLDNVRFILACNGTRYTNKIKHHDGSETLIEEPIEQFLDNNVVVQVTIASPDFDLLKKMETDIKNISNVFIVNQHKALVDSSFEKVGTIYHDIVDNSTSKGDAIKHFCELLNIPKEDRVAIGDDKNDLSMFEQCGYKVAMKNSISSVLEIADYVTDDNNNDGVAKFLEKLYMEAKSE